MEKDWVKGRIENTSSAIVRVDTGQNSNSRQPDRGVSGKEK